MDVLTFFIFPVATVLLAFALEKLLRSPILTAITFFAIYLILAFTAYDSTFLINAIAYTLIAYIVALIAEYIYINCTREKLTCNCNNSNNQNLSNEVVDAIANRVVDMLTGRNCNRRR